MAHLLECTDLTMRFGGLVALNALEMHVDAGETVGLVGPNGSGKTTFFNVVTGIYRASAGRVVVDGRDITGASPQEVCRAGVTRTFQRSHRLRQHHGRQPYAPQPRFHAQHLPEKGLSRRVRRLP